MIYQKTETIQDFQNRIIELEKYANDDGISVSTNSKNEFWQFIYNSDFKFKKDALFLTDNCNLRAVWSDSNNHLGLEFLGNSTIHFVIFTDGYSTVKSGVDSQNNIVGIIKLYGLESLCAF